MKFTVGMAVASDFDGAVFTCQHLKLFHADRVAQIIVVDNQPGSRDSAPLADYCKKAGVKYVPMPTPTGTAPPRNRVFAEADGGVVVCVDSHVLLVPNALDRLADFYARNPDRTDHLVQGPLLYESGGLSTHFDDEWRGEMWGTWGRDSRVDSQQWFPIPAQGLGLFACSKSGWLGFNDKFRGFGGEEWYIHEKYRQAGRQCWCVSGLQWWHRFARPAGVPYPLTRYHKLRNYVIGHQELGLPLDRVQAHFLDAGLVTVTEWEAALAGDENPPKLPNPTRANRGCGCGKKDTNDNTGSLPTKPERQPVRRPATVEEWYGATCSLKSDINEHLPTLREWAAKSDVVVELGTRHCVSTVALVAGARERVLSVDIEKRKEVDRLVEAADGKFEFVQGDSRTVEIPECDGLFIDTLHTADQIHAELTRHSPRVRHWIACHDTVSHGETGEGGDPGILPALRRFLNDNREWTVVRHDKNNNGLMILSRKDEDKEKTPSKWRMALNFTKTMAAHAANGARTVTDDEWQERMDQCVVCEHRVYDQCSICGCFISAKASLAVSECPDSPPRWRKSLL